MKLIIVAPISRWTLTFGLLHEAGQVDQVMAEDAALVPGRNWMKLVELVGLRTSGNPGEIPANDRSFISGVRGFSESAGNPRNMGGLSMA